MAINKSSKGAGKGKVKPVVTTVFQNVRMVDWHRDHVEVLIGRAREKYLRPIIGALADGDFRITEKGVITLGTLTGAYKRSVSLPAARMSEHFNAVLALIKPEAGNSVISNAVDRISEKDAADDLKSLFADLAPAGARNPTDEDNIAG